MLHCRKILDREEEFVKLNEELDIQTQGLLLQLDNARRCRDAEDSGDNGQGCKSFSKTSEHIPDMPSTDHEEGALRDEKVTKIWSGQRQHSSASVLERKPEKMQTNLPVPNIGGGLGDTPKLTRHRSEVKIREKYDGGVVPDAVKSLGQDGMIRFLKAKVQILSEQLESVQKDEKKMIQKVKECQSERERVSEDRDKWIQQANLAKNMLAKHESHASNIVLQLQSTQAENSHFKREIEKLKKELRQITRNSGSNEVRLNRSVEEAERLKSAIRQMKQEDKEMRESHKKKSEELTAALKKAEKQKLDLLHAFKKQFVVIDNLKKQRGLTDAGKQLKSIEEDFMDFLDWSPTEASP